MEIKKTIKENYNKLKEKIHPKIFFLILLLILLAGLCGLGYVIHKKGYFNKIVKIKPPYAQAFTLTDDQVSQNANITINLPVGINKEQALINTTFTPEIKGAWIDTQSTDKIVYKPEKALVLGNYYSVSLQTPQGPFGKDFLAVEDPKIETIFPKTDSEAPENSDITIIFNRPMVPLTTLDVMENFKIPVEITPATEGKYKWINTKTLQFIPQTALIGSANYTVKINPGFASMDGLPVAPLDHKFLTRKLRYELISENNLIYKQPFTIRYNQEVDLEKTINDIWMKNTDKDQRIDFIAEYGIKRVFNQEKKKFEEKEDKSAIFIYNSKDSFGRKKLWDFNTNYFIHIGTSYPIKGDIILNEPKDLSFHVDNIIKTMTADSQRTNFAEPSFFDPEGNLNVEFYEEIDLSRSNIEAQALKEIKYGEKCVGSNNEDNDYYASPDTECQKETDRKKIIIGFDPSKLNYGQQVDVNFNRIYNLENQKINSAPVIKQIQVIPMLQILRTVPDDNASSSILTEFVVCSNSPITPPASEEIGDFLKVAPDYEFKSWERPQKVPNQKWDWFKCNTGEFETKIYYGIAPETDYSVEIKAVDAFGHDAQKTIHFKSGKMPEYFLNFYHLQGGYNVTTPNKTTLTYAAENMDYVNLHICKLTATQMLNYLSNKPSYTESPQSVSGCSEVKTAKINLPKRYWLKNYFNVDLSDYFKAEPGHYILTFSNPDYKERWDKERPIYERSYLTITNMAAVAKETQINNAPHSPEYNLSKAQIAQTNNLYWVTKISDLSPVDGAEIDVYAALNSDSAAVNKVGSYTTNNSGIAQTPGVDHLKGVIINNKNDSAIVLGNENNLDYSSTAYNANNIYLYTDRPIYRPGNEVFFKGLYRIGYDGDYEIYNEKKVDVKAFDSSGKEIFSQALGVDDFGTFNSKFIIDQKAPLGQYRIETQNNYFYFDVEEYVPSAFKAEAKTDKEEYISGQNYKLDVSAAYYFGAPVSEGEVEYSVVAQNYYFDKYKGDYFDFGGSWYGCYYGCEYGDKFILRNKTTLNKDGQAQITGSTNLSELFKNPDDRKSKIFTVYLTVKNANGQSVSTQKSFIVHAGEFYIGIKTDKYFIGKNELFNVKLKTVDTNGNNLKVNNIFLAINKVKWITNKRKEVDGGYYYQSEKKLEPIITSEISTDNDGNWQGDFSLKEEGEYEITATAKDNLGNTITGESDLYVWGEGDVDIRPSNNTNLEIITDKAKLNVGDTGEIIIKSPYEKAKALISIERGKIFKYEIVDINQSLFNYKFLIGNDYVPNIYVTATLLSEKPEIKYGNLNFYINKDTKKINIEAKTDKEFYLPGETVNLVFKATDLLNKPLISELSVVVADLSVLALKGNPHKNPLEYFYSGFPHTISTASNLKNILYEVEISNKTKGGGGAESIDLAKKKRGNFRDTAFWQAVLNTDADGNATTSFVLPDNLTTWQLEGVGITKDTKLGVCYKEFVARKDVMLVPLTPRFIIPGDEFKVGAQIFNQTKNEQNLEASLSDTSLTINGDQKKSLSLNPGESKTIYFTVTAPSAVGYGNHKLVLSAKNNNYEDTVEKTIKIVPNSTYESVATAGYSKAALVNEYVYLPNNIIQNEGGISIKNSATLAVYLSDALNYMLSYPYGCSEQISSKLDSIAVIKRGLNIENIGDKFNLKNVEFDGNSYTIDELVPIGLSKLYLNQREDGGFSYWPGAGESDFYLSLQIANSFQDLSLAGYSVDKDRFRRLYEYINNYTQYGYNYFYENNDQVIIAAYTLARLSEFGPLNKNIVNFINGLSKKEKFLNEDISSLSLAYLSILLSTDQKDFSKKFANNVYDLLENRITIDSRGAFLKPNLNFVWNYYETPVKDTSLLLEAFMAKKDNNPTMDSVLRWILNSRSTDGSWGTTNNNINVISALTDFLIWKKENLSDFNLTVSLDNIKKADYTYSAKNILEQNSLFIPTNDLKFNSLNVVSFNKVNNNNEDNNFYYDMLLKYYLPIETIPPRDEGFSITRKFYRLDDKENKNPVDSAQAGEVLKGHLEIILPKYRNFVTIEDYIPAGVELVNFNLDTENLSAIQDYNSDNSEKNNYANENDLWFRSWFYDHNFNPEVKEIRDDRLFLYRQNLDAGIYEYDYYVRALVPGKFHHLPAVASEMYFPENFGRTSGSYFTVNEKY